MLDKSLPYHHIIMKRTTGTPIPRFDLPDGFLFTDFAEGDEKDWADILVSVGEFDNADDALERFREDYLPHRDQLERRIQFIRTTDGRAVGTATCWWRNSFSQRSPSLEWVAVRPEYHGHGLGKAMVSKAMKRMVCMEGDNSVYLHTQTWSYHAIGIYKKMGFFLLSDGSFGEYPNEYDKAMGVLSGLLRA